MKSLYRIITSVILLCGSIAAAAQNRVITGVIKNSQGPLSGISVVEKDNPNNGVSSDAQGRFRLALQGSSNALIISGVGYATQEVSVAGQQTVDVTVSADAKGLDEVVVVGYGTQKRVNVTGSVSSVNREEIQRTPSASLQNALTGKLPGFFSQQQSGRPGKDGALFFVRGVSTFNGSTQPLILVDDIEFTYADFANIDPNEVQSISILKDAATTAVYGVKGANGVILVTTRRGLVGTPKVNLRTEAGAQIPTHIPKFLNAYETALLRNEAVKNDAYISGATYVPEFTDEDLKAFQTGSDPYGHPDINWYNTLFKKATYINKNNLDLSGGTDAVRYFVSLGYENQSGILRSIKASDNINNNYFFHRYNFRSNLDIKANESLSFRVDLSGNNSVTNSPKFAGVSGSAETAAFYEVFNYESLSPYIYNIYNPNGTYGYTNPNRTQPSGQANNIIGRIANGGYTRERQNLLNLNVSAFQKLDFITKGLQAKILVSVTNGTNASRSLNRTNFPSYYYNPVTSTYTPRDASVYRVDPFALTYAAGRPSRQSSLQASLNYARTFGRHGITALGLINQSTQLRPDFVSDVEQTDSYQPVKLRGIISRVTYSYDNKYLLEFDGGYNGSTKFAASHRYGFFPAGSAGWVISREAFVRKHLPFITLFKLRGSYGISGSDDLGSFRSFYEETFNRGGAYNFGVTSTAYTSIVPGSLGNDDVTWEKERKADIGLDFSFLGGKISGSADVFDNRRYDILALRNTISAYFGVPDASLPPQNLGIVSNKGYEFELGYNPTIGKVRLSFKANYSYAKNKILEFDEVNPKYEWKRLTGQSIGVVQMWIFDGFYSVAEAADPKVPKYIGSTTASGGAGTTVPGFLKYRDLNGDGVITTDDMGIFGKPNLPNTNIGFNTGITYKRFSINILLQSALNSEVQIGYTQSTPFKGNLQEIHMQRFTPETAATAQFPSLVTNFQGTYMSSGQTSTYWAISGNYLRLKSVELGYELPAKLISRIGLRGARFYVNGYNLRTWSATYKRFGLDPETARGGSGNDFRGVYPQSAIVNLGLNLTIK